MQPQARKRIPKRLRHEPLIEAIWELRFSGSPAIGMTLPGAILEKLRSTGRVAKPEPLPLANVPVEFRDAQESLRFGATAALRQDTYTLMTGNNVVALSVLRPYPGWADFKARILELVGWIKDFKVVEKPATFSIRYIDFFDGSPSETLQLLDTRLCIGGIEPESGEIHLRMPLAVDGFQGLLQIINPANRSGDVDKTTSAGLVTDVLMAGEFGLQPEDWNGFERRLDKAKAICHDLFFAILKPGTIDAMEPIYEE